MVMSAPDEIMASRGASKISLDRVRKHVWITIQNSDGSHVDACMTPAQVKKLIANLEQKLACLGG